MEIIFRSHWTKSTCLSIRELAMNIDPHDTLRKFS